LSTLSTHIGQNFEQEEREETEIEDSGDEKVTIAAPPILSVGADPLASGVAYPITSH
jgi:hypothetical protein